jgi:predicted TIM-barrel fold metal-dependent hydrolase
MYQDYRVIDADAHVIEPPDLWEKHIDPEFRGQAPRGHGLFSLEVMGHRLPDLTGLGARAEAFAASEVGRDWRQVVDPRVAFAARRGYDAASHLEAMDREGIDMAVLYPTRGLFAAAADGLPPDLVGAICRAYNRWLAAFCSHAPHRLFGAALVALHDPEIAAREAAHAVEELGHKAIFLRPNPINGRTIDHRDHDEFFAEVERLGVPLGLHDAAAPHVAQFGRDRYDRMVKVHMMCHAVESMGACMDLIVGGVLERHPHLRCAFLEATSGWVPWWLDRMDGHCHSFERLEGSLLTMEPSAYFKRQCFVSAEPEERAARHVVEALGPGNLVVGSDYPHGDGCFPRAIALFTGQETLSDAAKRQALWDNPIRLYGLEKEAARLRAAA